MPVNEIYFVSLTYTLRLDGSAADIKNANGQKIGTIQMTRSASQYTFNMKGPGRPDSQGTLTVSADGKTLISESGATQSGQACTDHQDLGLFDIHCGSAIHARWRRRKRMIGRDVPHGLFNDFPCPVQPPRYRTNPAGPQGSVRAGPRLASGRTVQVAESRHAASPRCADT